MVKNAKLFAVPVGDISVENRLRDVDADYVEGVLAPSFRDIGLRSPIEVREIEGGKYKLVFGAHRLAAAKLLGWETIEAIVRTGDENDARLAEIDENLIRSGMNALQLVEHLQERRDIAERQGKHVKRGGDRRSKNQSDNESLWSFNGDAADKMGVSQRHVKRYLSVAHNLSPALRTKLHGTKHAENLQTLLKIAAQPDHAKEIVTLLTRENDPLPSVKAALEKINGTAVKPKDKTAPVIDFIIRASVSIRVSILRAFIENGKVPEGWSIMELSEESDG